MTPQPTPTPNDGVCEVPLVEQLLSVPKDAREMIEVEPMHHRNIPYGPLCHEAADRIKKCERENTALQQQLTEAEAKVGELRELHTMQLAGIMTASIQNTESTVKDRIDKSNPYWTQAYGDVCRAVDREMKLHAELNEAKELIGLLNASLEKADRHYSNGDDLNINKSLKLARKWREKQCTN